MDLYDTVRRRRDVRGQFTSEPVAHETLIRVLEAAHAAPSVGLSQPWDFILIEDAHVRRAFWEHVQAERLAFAATLDAERAALFDGIKIDGILESTLSVIVTYDSRRGLPGVLGRHTIADAGLYSTCLAIQNLWLAATAEGLGVGWVSFYQEEYLRALVGIPSEIRPIAWLCVGPITHLEERPDLERAGWRSRRPLNEAIHIDHWGNVPDRDHPQVGLDDIAERDVLRGTG